ncbi:MAG TPA: Holliday junction branch migration protein RuvA [Patescibacteria group bacterium]|nr:Holliday junction branch migration protein RuvA [Patescibacteria group bacterium]
MIGSIAGKIQHKGTGFLIVETGGVGYKVFVTPPQHFEAKVGSAASFVIHTYVREDQITLYGFSNINELEFFELLLTVSGVGPKSALGIMSVSSLDMIKSAIASGDAGLFKKVSGIGTKTAERVIVELREKLKSQGNATPIAAEHSDALEALMTLGYREQQAREALKNVPESKSVQDKIKLALKNLQK